MKRTTKRKVKEYRKVEYIYYCFDCKSDFIMEYYRDKDKKHPICLVCESKNTKCMGENPSQGLKIKGGGDEMARNRRKLEKFVEYGLDKGQADKFYKDSIEASKERMKSGYEHYSKVFMDVDYFAKTGQAKPVNDENRVKKMKVAKEVTIDAAKKARTKPETWNKQGTLAPDKKPKGV